VEGSAYNFTKKQEGIRVVVRIRSSSPTDSYCVVEVVDGAKVDKYPPFAAKITRDSGALRLQASGKTILSSKKVVV
jgi:hypothetical protein